MTKRVYISGVMRSRMDTYKGIFSDAQRELEKDYIVINPALLPIGLESDKYMPICFAMIDAVDAIYMLKGWEQSEGACLEKAYAEYHKKKVMYE